MCIRDRLCVILGTFCLFTAGSIAFLKWLRRRKNFYYQPGHFISVSGMIYRMKQNAAGLAAICIDVYKRQLWHCSLYAGIIKSRTGALPCHIRQARAQRKGDREYGFEMCIRDRAGAAGPAGKARHPHLL